MLMSGRMWLQVLMPQPISQQRDCESVPRSLTMCAALPSYDAVSARGWTNVISARGSWVSWVNAWLVL